MSLFSLKPTHAPVKAYYAALDQFLKLGHTTEGNTRSAFADLLKKCASPYKWHLVEEFPFKGTGKQRLIADGVIEDSLGVVQGHWEAKDALAQPAIREPEVAKLVTYCERTARTGCDADCQAYR